MSGNKLVSSSIISIRDAPTFNVQSIIEKIFAIDPPTMEYGIFIGGKVNLEGKWKPSRSRRSGGDGAWIAAILGLPRGNMFYPLT